MDAALPLGGGKVPGQFAIHGTIQVEVHPFKSIHDCGLQVGAEAGLPLGYSNLIMRFNLDWCVTFPEPKLVPEDFGEPHFVMQSRKACKCKVHERASA